MIECYRVILLQLPPQIYLTGSSGTDSASDPGTDANETTLFEHITAFMTPGSLTTPISCSFTSKSSLAALTALTWNAISTAPGSPQASRLWNAEIFDLAFNSWIQAHEISIDPAVMILFHTNTIIMHTNMMHVHGLARLHLQNSTASHG